MSDAMTEGPRIGRMSNIEYENIDEWIPYFDRI
jgi:hypothetical protein